MAKFYRAVAPLAGALVLGAAPSPVDLKLTVENLRNSKGKVQICVTHDQSHFPDCAGDPAAIRQSQGAGDHTATLSLPPGNYAVSLIHDENGNGKLDKVLGIPREGFAFSRNPRIAFGPPGYEDARIEVGDAGGSFTLRVRYLL